MMGTANDGSAPLAISVSLLPGSFGHASLATSLAPTLPVLVMLRDVGTAVALDANALNSLFGLSAAECDVAVALAGGLAAEGIAEQRGRAMPTVRAQIRHILRKTGTQSVRHLAGMLARLDPFR